MADSARHEIISDDSFEAANAIPRVMDDLEDEASERQPIDLDEPIDIDFSSIPEPADGEPGDEDSAPASTALDLVNADKMEELRQQAADANDKYLRTLAEFQNYRRRTDDDIKRRVAEGNEKLIQQLLPSLDDFELAITAAQKSESYEQLIGGVEAMSRKLADTFRRQGIEPIPAVGERFDATLHEAVMLDEDSDQPDETITAELRRGYTMQGRVIRPSLVKVAKAG